MLPVASVLTQPSVSSPVPAVVRWGSLWLSSQHPGNRDEQSPQKPVSGWPPASLVILTQHGDACGAEAALAPGSLVSIFSLRTWYPCWPQIRNKSPHLDLLSLCRARLCLGWSLTLIPRMTYYSDSSSHTPASPHRKWPASGYPTEKLRSWTETMAYGASVPGWRLLFQLLRPLT